MDRYLSGRITLFCKIFTSGSAIYWCIQYLYHCNLRKGSSNTYVSGSDICWSIEYLPFPFFPPQRPLVSPSLLYAVRLLTGREVTLLTDNEPWYMGGQKARSHDTSAPIFAGPAYHCGIPRYVWRSPISTTYIYPVSWVDSLSRSKTTLDCHKERSNPPPSKILRALLDWLNNQLASLWRTVYTSNTSLWPLKWINQPQFTMLCYQCINCSLNSYLYRYQILRTNYPGAPPQHPQLLAISHALSLPIPGYRTPRSTPPPLRRLRRTVQYAPQRQFSM